MRRSTSNTPAMDKKAQFPNKTTAGEPHPEMKSRLDQISTVPEIKADAGQTPDPRKIAPQLVTRYQKAIRKYLASILRQAGVDHVDDAYNDIYLAALTSQLGVLGENERFRDFLKK